MSPGRSLCAIKAFSVQFGASFRTIRYYEKMGLLRPKRVRRSRFFSEDDYSRMRFIESAKALGLTLGEIAELLQSSDDLASLKHIRIPAALIAERVITLEQQRTDLDQKLARLKALQLGATLSEVAGRGGAHVDASQLPSRQAANE